MIGVFVSYHQKIITSAWYYEFDLIFMIFGRTDLRIGVSEAKFDAEVDFEVHFTPAPYKISKNCEQLMLRSKICFKFSKFFRVRPNASERFRIHQAASE